MSQKYLFPCPACDQKIPIDTAQAGQTSTCPSCSAAVTLPSFREIRQLPPSEEKEAKRRDTGWRPVQGVIFAIGAIVLIVSAALGAYIHLFLSHLDTTEKKWDDVDKALSIIDSLPPEVAYEQWKLLTQEGIGARNPPAFVRNRELMQYWRPREIVAWIVAGAGLLCAIVSVFIGPLLPAGSGRRRPPGG